jgi:hypothetical protein
MSLNQKCGAWVPLQRLSESFFIVIRYERDMIKLPRVVEGLLSSCTIVLRNYLINGTFYEKKLLKIKCVLIFSIISNANDFRYNKKWARYDQKSSRSLRVIVNLYNSFPNYLLIGTFYEKMALNVKSVAWVALQRLSETFFTLIRNERDMNKLPRVV